MCLSMCLSIDLTIDLPVYRHGLFFCRSTCLSVCTSSVGLLVYQAVCPSTERLCLLVQPVCLYKCLHICLARVSISQYTYQFVVLDIPFFYRPVCLSIALFINRPGLFFLLICLSIALTYLATNLSVCRLTLGWSVYSSISLCLSIDLPCLSSDLACCMSIDMFFCLWT